MSLFRLRDPTTVLPTIIAGLQTYFDRALGANLLYCFERPQYAEIRKRYVTGPTVQVGQEREMSAVYGAEHLLRMIGEPCISISQKYYISICFPPPVSLPQMVAGSTMDPESVALVRHYVTELMKYVPIFLGLSTLIFDTSKLHDQGARPNIPNQI